MAISSDDRARIGAAIRAAEAGTAGEIVCVLARRASTYTVYPLAWATFGALLLPWPLVRLTQLPVERILSIQLLAFVALFVLLSAPPLRIRLVPRRVLRGMAHRVAAEQFAIRGLGRKAHGAGVLVFVSLAERYARIMVGDALAEKVDAAVWRDALAALTAHLRDGRIADGFVTAVGDCGAVLAAHVPAATHENALPDRIYVI
jgi:putative membrane protein